MRRMQQLPLYLLLTALSVAHASPISTPALFSRQSACGANASQCSQIGLPSEFCCQAGTQCIALAANTTVLCCPTGNSCTTVLPIPCDISVQNATGFPSNAVKTTVLNGIMGTCGNACCPFGYSCNDAAQCIRDSDQSRPPSTSSTSPTTSPTARPSTTRSDSTASPTPTSAKTTDPAASATASPPTSDPLPSTSTTTNAFPPIAVLVGFFPGLLAGILATLLVICLIGARRRRTAARRHSGSSFGNISDPQPANNDMRTDFLRKPPATPSSSAPSPSRSGTVRKVKSFLRRSTPHHHQQHPVTPPLQRQPSYEDINIFADGDTASALRRQQARVARESHQTTFSDMMEQTGLAGLQKGQPYVYRGNGSPAPMRRTP